MSASSYRDIFSLHLFFLCLCKFEKRQLDEVCVAKLMFMQNFLGEDLILIDFLNRQKSDEEDDEEIILEKV